MVQASSSATPCRVSGVSWASLDRWLLKSSVLLLSNLLCISNRFFGVPQKNVWTFSYHSFKANIRWCSLSDHPKIIWKLPVWGRPEALSCCWRVIARWSVIIINSINESNLGTFVLLLSTSISCIKLGVDSIYHLEGSRALLISLDLSTHFRNCFIWNIYRLYN